MEYKQNQFKNLIVWQQAMDFTIDIYNTISTFPDNKKFALANQLTRATVSIPSNIAEGAGRQSKKEFAQFLSIAYASCCEAETQLIIAQRLKYINDERINLLTGQSQSIQKMINSLKRSLFKEQELIK